MSREPPAVEPVMVYDGRSLLGRISEHKAGQFAAVDAAGGLIGIHASVDAARNAVIAHARRVA